MQTVVVVGGGLAGIATSYELVRRNYRTILVETRAGVALETSFANGGLLTPSMADPWNAPGLHRHLIASLFGPNSAMKVRLSALPSLLSWGLQFIRNSTPARHEAATIASFLLSKYSVEQTQLLRTRLALQYDAGARGSLKVFDTRAAMDAPLALAAKLSRLGLRFRALEADGTVALEPALAEIRGKIAGAIHFPDDESGDAHQFCERLMTYFLEEGGIDRTGSCVTGIAVERGGVCGVHIAGRIEPADIVIVAAGNSSVKLLRGVGLSLAIRPVKGYTLTFDVSHVEGTPSIPIIADALHAAVVPIGSRLRIAGTAEFTGDDLRIRPDRIANLIELLARMLPRVARQLSQATPHPWAALRPMSADGLPFIGPTQIRGLHLNTGHGHLGWTLAVGSASVLADLIENKPPDIDPWPYRALR
jgi:D-amino-acid dehydrogenase